MLSFWLQEKPTLPALLLSPLGWLYGQAAKLHGTCRAKRPYYAAVPVISVGNLTVGGAGKTPVTRWLTEAFLSQGHTVAIVSRGYKGSESGQPTRVDATLHSAAQVGDEPLMLARVFAHKPVQVWVGRNRPAAVRRAEQAGASLILLDDGFQRRDVARTVDILVVDGSTAFGNRLPMPAGPLREFPAAATRAHFAIVLNEPAEHRNRFYGLPAYRLTTGLAQGSVATLPPRPPVAFAGLAHPEKFFTSLQRAGVKPAATVPFPDHHTYTEKDLTDLKELAAKHRAPLVTTEKDAVKLPPRFATVLPLEVTGSDADAILADINTRLR